MLALGHFGLHIHLAHDSVRHTYPDAWHTLRLVAETLTATYLALIAGCYTSNKSVTRHTSLTRHIFALAAISALHRYLVSLGQYLDIHSTAIVHWSQYLDLGLSFTMTVVSGLTPLGPELHKDILHLYSKAVDTKLVEAGYDGQVKVPNVNQEVSASIFSRLIFHFVLPMILKTSRMDQVDVADLPAAHAYLCSQNIVRDAYDVNTGSGISGRFGPTVGLLWAVWRPEWKTVLTSEWHWLRSR